MNGPIWTVVTSRAVYRVNAPAFKIRSAFREVGIPILAMEKDA